MLRTKSSGKKKGPAELPQPTGSLAGKVAIVTGGSRGIGKFIAKRLASEGASVVIAGRTMPHLRITVEEIAADGGRVIAVQTDVSNEKSVHRLLSKTLTEFGTIDILINNAGQYMEKAVTDMSVADWNNVIGTNLTGPFLLSRAVLPEMIEKMDGTIIMISSTSGKRAKANSAAYSASKFGIEGFSEALLREVRDYNIRVIVVTPSSVDSSDRESRQILKGGKGARLRAEDVAETVVAAIKLPPRALIREVELWATNP
ncbi:MAG TPA: SDR family NAD(P)-dependent oxidoreductase [Candidatus Kryptobacter bacterium]|nr:SDR family NAD(P)-dependent oxidoreductase [Candidatus Kryptobacter bacterium]